MGTGKVLCIIGAILTLISTFLLSLFSIDITSAGVWLEAETAYGSGLGFFLHIGDIFGDIDGVATEVGVESFLIYIFIVLLIFWAISGILQLIGVKSKAAGIIGSIMPLFLGVIIILATFITLPDFFGGFTVLLSDNTQLLGFLPYDLPLGGFSLGAYTLTAGGILGLIGGIKGP